MLQSQAAEPAYDEHDDVHSGDEDSLVDTTASISSSILNYRTIHGRTYHSERGNAQYWYAQLNTLLNDDCIKSWLATDFLQGAPTTRDRMNRWTWRASFQSRTQSSSGVVDTETHSHHALTLAIGGKLHLAPLGDNLKVSAPAQPYVIQCLFVRLLTRIRLSQKVVDIGTGPGLWAMYV